MVIWLVNLEHGSGGKLLVCVGHVVGYGRCLNGVDDFVDYLVSIHRLLDGSSVRVKDVAEDALLSSAFGYTFEVGEPIG